MDACRELETKYGLHSALKKEREFGDNFIRKIDYERGDVKRQISNTVRSLLQMYRFQTLGEYNALLGLYNIDVKHVKGKKFGKEYNGIIYSAKNDKGEIVSNPFKSSLFGKTFGFEGLIKIMKNNTEIMKTKDITSRSKAAVSAAMKTVNTREEFENALRSKGMDVVFRTNDAGRIYGVTFIDHENKVVLNGSRLGKEFSANVFHAWFNEGRQPQPPHQRIPERENNPAQTPVNVHQNTTESSPKFDTSTMEELFGILDLKHQGEDYEEIAFARRMRKKIL
jgi:ribosomal protein L35AE/L33A